MPLYNLKCSNCGKTQEMFLGKVVDGSIIEEPCKFCGTTPLKKIPAPINTANFGNKSSRRTLKTRTGVGEVQMTRGAQKFVDKTTKK